MSKPEGQNHIPGALVQNRHLINYGLFFDKVLGEGFPGRIVKAFGRRSAPIPEVYISDVNSSKTVDFTSLLED
jgi:hypothetical protein